MNDAVGDLHGDFERTLWALQLAGVLSKDGLYRWIGGTTVTNKQTNWLVKSFFQFNKAEEAKIRVVEQSKFTNCFCCIDLIDPNDLCCCIELTPIAGWQCLH
jgi:hypothetical protein